MTTLAEQQRGPVGIAHTHWRAARSARPARCARVSGWASAQRASILVFGKDGCKHTQRAVTLLQEYLKSHRLSRLASRAML